MSGGHYVRGKRGIALISEALHRLQLLQFLKISDCAAFEGLFVKIEELQELFEKENLHQRKIEKKWNECKEKLADFKKVFENYRQEGKLASDQFKYWELFLHQIMPVLRDLTRSHREGNWQLHLSAVRRALNLFFAFDRTNYSRWVPLYYEDCVALEKNFPAIYASFSQGGFVVRHTLKCGSGVPMDQALEKEYNKPAKGQGGIIGISRRKEAVAQWNITKHDKAKFTKHLHELCSLNDKGEYTLHHECSQSLIEADEECVVQIGNYIAERNNPFDTSSVTKLTNLVTGKGMDEETSSFLLACVKTGEDNCNRFREARLIDKKEKLFDPITKVRKMRKNSAITKKADVKKRNNISNT